MTHQEFEIQVGRLNSQWRSAYGEERKAILWRAFQSVLVEDFTAAVEKCLASMRHAPLLEELSKEVDAAKSRRISNEGYRGVGSVADLIRHAADNNTVANPEYVKACTKLFADFVAGRVTREQFQQGCGWLDTTAEAIRPTRRKSTLPCSTGLSGKDRAANEKEIE